VGTIEQVPPLFSALKLDGQRAHDLARQGKDVSLAARPVRIDAIRVTAYEWPFLDVEVDCGKGTYIRSIARDVGANLGCGGLVQMLRRTRVGPFTAEQGIGLDVDQASVKLLPLELAATGLPQVVIEKGDAKNLFNGQAVRVPPRTGHRGGAITVAVMAPGKKLIAIGEDNGAGVIRPVTVLTNPEG
jgi:tRNA pseudouridine55 synthase